MNPVRFANTVAKALGHHFSLPDEQLARIETVADWHAATVAASEAYDSNLPTPTAPWPLVDGRVEYTTPTGRLAVCASDDGAFLTIFAGPKPNTVGRVELQYDWDAGVYRVSVLAGVSEPPAIVGLWCEAGEGWKLHYAYRPEWPGRPIIQVYTEPSSSGDWTIGVEWANPALVFDEGRYDRLDLLYRLDRDRYFNGAISAADRTGRLTQAAAQYADQRAAESVAPLDELPAELLEGS